MDLKSKAFSTQMNPHFVFNTLNSIQYFITTEDKKAALTYLSSFSKLIRFYLSNMGTDMVRLKREIMMLKQYLKLQKLRYDDKFEYKIHGEIESQDILIPSFVVHNLLENVIEQGIFHQHQNQKLDIQFKVGKGIVLTKIHYRYMGLQIKTAYVPDYREQIVKWQEQIKLLNKVKGYTIEKTIRPIKGGTGFQGTKIEIVLPIL
ncbi:MAG: histidine kinase [Bacteroidota bacterium]